MSSHNTAIELHSDYLKMVDPGNAGSISVDRTPAYVPLVSGAGAETRTLARPTREGAELTLCMDTDGGGDITLTVTGGYNEAGSTTFVFANAGEFAKFTACKSGATYFWRKHSDSLASAGTSPTQSAALTAALGGTLDTTYGQAELDEINNMIVRIGEIEAALERAGIVAPN